MGRIAGIRTMFITTHSPFFVNALSPDEVWVLEKQEDGFSTITRASDFPLVKQLYEEEIELGNLWYSDYFGKLDLVAAEI